jgi:RNA polymerase sigma factor (sigma-70 family)
MNETLHSRDPISETLCLRDNNRDILPNIVIPLVRNMAASMFKRRDLQELIDDAVSEVSAKIAVNLPKYQEWHESVGATASSFRGWVLWFARFRLIDFIREHNSQKGPGHPDFVSLDSEQDSHSLAGFPQALVPVLTDDCGADYEESQFAAYLWDALLPQVLTEQDVNILKLLYVKGASQTDVAHVYGRSQGWVSQRRRGALLAIKEHARQIGMYHYGIW